MKAIKLEKGERIVDVGLNGPATLVWGKPSAFVRIAKPNGSMRMEILQHEDMVPALQSMLFAGDATRAEMIAAIPTYTVL